MTPDPNAGRGKTQPRAKHKQGTGRGPQARLASSAAENAVITKARCLIGDKRFQEVLDLFGVAEVSKIRECDRAALLDELDRACGRAPSSRPHPDGGARLFAHATEKSLELVRANLPSELRQVPQWVCCDRRLTSSKAPLNPRTGRNARTNDPTTWATFDAAVKAALGNYRAFGVGIVLTNTDFVGLDLDHVVDPVTKKINAQAQQLIDSLPATYWERSPSGRGLRGFYRGSKPKWLTWTKKADAFGPGSAIEVYDGSDGRYLTVTGWKPDRHGVEAVKPRLHKLVDGDLDPLRRFGVGVPKHDAPTGGADGNESLDGTKVRAALAVIPAEDRDTWLRIGMALHRFGAAGRELWDEWSMKSPKFDDGDSDRVWASFKGERRAELTLGTIFFHADKQDPSWRDEARKAKAFEVFASHPLDAASAPNEAKIEKTAKDPFDGRWLRPEEAWLVEEPSPQRFLVRHPAPLGSGPGLLPRGVAGFLGGEGGIGKTVAQTDLAVAIVTGGAWFDYFPVDEAAGLVLLLTAEEDVPEVRRRLYRATRRLSAEQRIMVRRRLVVAPMHGRDVAMLARASSRDVAAPTPFLAALRARLEREAERDGWAAILVGPLSRLAGVPLDADNANATAIVQVFESLTELPGNPTVLVDCHTNADSRRQGKASVRGPTGLVDGVRWWASLHRSSDGGPIEFTVRKSNRGPLNGRAFILERDADGLLRVQGDAATAINDQQKREDELRAAAKAREAQVLEIMAELGGSVTSREAVYALMSCKTAAKRAAFAECERRGQILARGNTRQRVYELAVGRKAPDARAAAPHTPHARGGGREPSPQPGSTKRERPKGENGRRARIDAPLSAKQRRAKSGDKGGAS